MNERIFGRDRDEGSSDGDEIFINGSLSHLTNYSMTELPYDMRYTDGNRIAIYAYSVLMAVATVGNLSVFSVLIRLLMRDKLSRINFFLLHLTVADLLVTFFIMPLEIGWNWTVSWEAGDTMCRIMSFFRIFGLLLSDNVLICISVDRYFAIVEPLSTPRADWRGRRMLALGWLMSGLCSLPQSFIFHVEQHPKFVWYEQCVTFNSFPSPEAELAYNFFGFFFLHGLPLFIIVFCYSRILCKIYRISRLDKNDPKLRRSSTEALRRAKRRTLIMTVIILATYILCWTPYNVMSLWYWFDRKSASEVDPRIQKVLFLFACTNSSVNPFIYGTFHFFLRPGGSQAGGGSRSTVPLSLPNARGHEPGMPRQDDELRQQSCCMTTTRGGGSEFTAALQPVQTHFTLRQGQQTMV